MKLIPQNQGKRQIEMEQLQKEVKDHQNHNSLNIILYFQQIHQKINLYF